MEVLYSIFLLISAWYDIRTAKIPVWLFTVFGTIGIVGLIIGLPAELSAGSKLTGAGIIAAFIPGIFLLFLTYWTRGAAGAGDGCFFIVSACYLGFSETFTLFIFGLLFCGTCGLGMAAWGFLYGINAGKMRLPFLPFVLPAWLWMNFIKLGWRL